MKTVRMLLGRCASAVESVVYDETVKPLFVSLHLFIYPSAARFGTFLQIQIAFQCSSR
jgi:hypothetical protein